MTNIADHDEAQASSLSAVDLIEDAFRSLKLTRTEAQNVVRALVEVVNRATSPTPTSPPSSSSHSRTSVDSAGALSVTSCSTCSFHSNRLVRGSPGSTATSTTAVSLMAASAPVSTNVAAAVSPIFASTPVVTPAAVTTTAVAPIVTPVPHVASVALAFVDTAPTVGNVAVAPLVAATVARTTSSVAAPLYAAVPPNAPSNAILPPAHLIRAPHGYHIPATNADGPFYVVARGRNLGIFSGWETVSPLVTGVSHAVYSRVASVAEGHARMNAAKNAAFALYLT